MTKSADGAIAVSVRSRSGDPGAGDDVTVGLLVDSTVVAFQIGPEDTVEFEPTQVEAVIAPLPFDACTVERIPVTQVDILVPEGSAQGPKVAFGTLANPCTKCPGLPDTSRSLLEAALRETGDLWSAVNTVSGQSADSLTGVPEHVVRQVDRHKAPGPRPVVRTRVAGSIEQIAIDWCDITPRCLPPE